MSILSDFVIENGTLKKYTGTASEVVIPEEVTSIGSGAFADCTTIESVHIPDSVHFISYRAFKNCENLKSVRMSKGIWSVDGDAFDGCTGLADDNGFAVIDGKLYGYYGNAEIVEIPECVSEIGDNVFCKKYAIKEVFLPGGIQKIGYCAFGEMSGIKLHIPKTVRPDLFAEDAFKERGYDECVDHFRGDRPPVPYVLDFTGDNDTHTVLVIFRLSNDYTSYNSSFSAYTTETGIDLAEYDNAVINGKRFKAPEKLHAAILRMTYPAEMEESARVWYIEFLQKNAKKAVAFACETDSDIFINTLIAIEAINAKNMKALKKQAEEAGAVKCIAALDKI